MPKTYRLLGPDGVSHDSMTPGLFGGHKKQRIYGRLDCRTATLALTKGDTYQQHRVFFANEASAIAAGYRPCAVCLPTQYRAWRATVK
jgi:methylphosphotriester-DNA--protein-cysteine methyltransferase